ncbi:Undecaprenyl-diphosphate phosphatase [Lentibacillus sp. JNUCC-1]|uniref:phosphatase PAP2 family protein n=1 Tax=Lentibacillus sp. JNUCC-1 TaxID=2654513 RepID=UPI0012E7773B|nr:phosphatase PAP2 family protein [Lentibacillus sp. JNUCC-1]MUV37895.1 Undecaprenyl-diphosphate phosphatase [Lentibacillus sp. JNUCC-1]
MLRERHSVAGLLLWGALFLIGFAVVAWGVTSKVAWVDAFDIYWIDRIQSHIATPITWLAKTTTVLGDLKLIIVLTIIIALVLFIKRLFAEGLWFGGTILFCGVILTSFMKKGFDRDRPEFLQLVEKTNGSFPSGHAVGTSLFYGLVGLVIILTVSGAWKKALIGLATSMVIVYVMLTRIYLGAHFPTDVVAGVCFGLASAFISVAVYIMVEERLRGVLHKIGIREKSRADQGA